MLSIATSEDIPAIMALDRGAGFEAQVGRWDAQEHARTIASNDARYLIAEGHAGFVLFQGLLNAHSSIRLRRIAVRQPGRGVGSAILRAGLTHAFNELGAHRVDLMVFVDNERACRAYLKAGFVEEGIMRDVHRAYDGTFRSMRLMSLLVSEWLGPA